MLELPFNKQLSSVPPETTPPSKTELLTITQSNIIAELDSQYTPPPPNEAAPFVSVNPDNTAPFVM
jgi:hypothetical protein